MSVVLLHPVPASEPEVLIRVCGVSDRAGLGTQVCKWPIGSRMPQLRIHVGVELPGFPLARMRSLFQAAMAWWGDQAQLDIVYTDDPGQANLVALTGRAGPQDQFDGPGGVLAWCELPCGNAGPQSTLQMRFDPEEGWTEQMLFLTIAHEGGHGLGIPHLQVKGNLMNPFLNLNQRQLGAGDLKEIWNRYGRRQSPPPPPPTETPQPTGEGILTIGNQRYRVIPTT